MASPTKLPPNHLIPRVFVYVIPLFPRHIDHNSRPRQQTPRFIRHSLNLYTTEPDLGTKGSSDVPSSAGEEPDSGRTVKRFRCPLRLPVRAQAFTPSDRRGVRWRFAGPDPDLWSAGYGSGNANRLLIHSYPLLGIFHRLRSTFFVCNIHETWLMGFWIQKGGCDINFLQAGREK